MHRRRMLTLAGATAAAGLAGCLDDVLGTEEENDPESTEEPDSTEETPDEGDGEDDAELSAEETVVAFYEAIADGDVDRVNELSHSDGIGPFEEEDLDGEPTVEETETVETDDETATVEALVVPGSASEPIQWTISLEREDGVWRVVSIEHPDPEDESALAPNAAFETERENGSRQIIHTAGDHIPAAELYIRGDGIEATGSWTDLDGRASATVDDEPAVSAGDSVTVGVSDDYTIRVVWDDGDSAVALMEMAGASDTATEADESGSESGNGADESGSESDDGNDESE